MNNHTWNVLRVTLPEELKEPVEAVLYENGCIGITDEAGILTAYFPSDANTGTIIDALSVFDGVRAEAGVIEEQDWYASWKEQFVPFVAEGLVICPPWREYETKSGEKLLILDPGQAFGTGDHVTTRTMLRMLRSWIAGQANVSGKRLLDLGTGTGVLTIAAYLYGLRDITAVDIEHQAVETAARNFELNGLKDKIRLLEGRVDKAGTGYDIILANIFLEALLGVMPAMASALNPGGCLAVSGLLSGQEGAVMDAAKSLGLEQVEMAEETGWVSLRFLAPR